MLAAGAPAPPHRQTRLLPLLLADSGAADHPGPGRRQAVGGGGGLPDRQRTRRPGPASGPYLALLAPLGHPRPACPRLPHRDRRLEHVRAPAPADQIPLTRNEIGHLFAVVLHKLWTNQSNLSSFERGGQPVVGRTTIMRVTWSWLPWSYGSVAVRVPGRRRVDGVGPFRRAGPARSRGSQSQRCCCRDHVGCVHAAWRSSSPAACLRPAWSGAQS